jgi:hypothetical protein
MSQPLWITSSGNLGTIPEGVFYSAPLAAIDPVITLVTTSATLTGGIATFTFATQSSIVFPLGNQVVLDGFSPSVYNGTYETVRSSTGSIGILNSSTEPITVFGTITNVPVTITYQVVAGALPAGIAIDETGLIRGVPSSGTIGGVPAQVAVDTVSQFAIRARNSNSLADRTFSLTVSVTNQPYFVTPAGNVGTYITGDQIFDLQIETYNPDVYGTAVIRLISGSLPPGLTIDTQGRISGVIENAVLPGSVPVGFSAAITQIGSVATVGINAQVTLDTAYPLASFNDAVLADDTGHLWVQIGRNTQQISSLWNDFGQYQTVSLAQGFDQAGFDFASGSNSPSFNYNFTLQVSNGQNSSLRTFQILVYARDIMSADTTYVTADNTLITTDTYNLTTPVITTPAGSIGTARAGNFFAFQFQGQNIDGNAFVFVASTVPDSLTLDPNSGWLYGLLPAAGATVTTYHFDLRVYDASNPGLISQPYRYSLTVDGPATGYITWITPVDLGTIVNGGTSTLYVQAISLSGFVLQYQLAGQALGDDPVYNLLPQGLQLLPSGHIAGRVSFNTFALDGGTTTFDLSPSTGATSGSTTFDLVFRFMVNVFSANGLVNENREFSIRLIRQFQEPFDNIYIQAMPPLADRGMINSLLQSPDIFPPDLIYRNDDPNFGVARRVVYEHAYGLTAATYDDYVNSLNINHYWKNLVLGEIDTAQALDDAGNVIYEVVYSRIIDSSVNSDGVSVGKSVTLPYDITTGLGPTQTVYPNSLSNMRTQVIDSVGQVSNVLPRWMLSKQADGSVLGFTPAWVIAYTVPGASGQIAYNIQTQFGIDRLNLLDFEVDRYELDNLLTKNWDRELQQWTPTPPTVTVFDFDVGQAPAVWINDLNPSIALPWINNLGNTVEWSYATPPGTTFDAGSLQFTDPVDMYSSTTAYDQYLLFPRRDIITPLGTYPPSFIPWYDDYDNNFPIAWYDDSNDNAPITWTTLTP